jgi:TRAP-type mannitol/chloroaromatic compound transport system substrate-binding protein
MPEQNNNRSSLSGLVAIGKDLVAMLRDTMLLLLAILLMGWPQAINSILVDAGFEEGSFAGLKWKAKLNQTDGALVKAQATIVDLKDQNDKLNKALSEVKSQIDNPEVKANITKLEQLNTQLVENATKVQASVESNISANAPLVQKIQASTGTVVTWGIVYGGDQNLNAAEYEIQTIAPKLGLTNVAIYYRQGSYRSVATTTDRLQAEQFLNKAKERRKDSYIVNMSTWCPNTTQKDGYFECLNL